MHEGERPTNVRLDGSELDGITSNKQDIESSVGELQRELVANTSRGASHDFCRPESILLTDKREAGKM